ncbi:4a-hydroxytetrahydrobiopterin dehydratase [Jatrophihabitans sp. GAS493]|uniref:4a-hydroxytetrahydrobiopterin dehydratase n=1 Tax=Jatrophihabitans sp. GAS493 TaxID=1907575 RepID=UPI000BB7D946|nr:4a-hydroxytetrahydrobiopterin dehydratase [Jatrophihabitans sp. GAS493]SOD71424.1 4a-hydroxytetrahydrobiopterin dehydratase [Jatrophihabitans sp. GAS493]
MSAALISKDDLEVGLAQLPAWQSSGEPGVAAGASITRKVDAPSFLAGIGWVRRIAEVAEDADHHPDIDIRWRSLTFTLSTHSAGGLTRNDLDLAARIDEIVAG